MDLVYSISGFNDPMSSLSHLAGTVVFFVLSILLLRSAWRSRVRFWYSFVFACSAQLLLSMSFVYHLLDTRYVARGVMLRMDVAVIFVLIAGTFTPIHGILFRGWRRWGMLLLIWTIAVTGITLRTIFFEHIPYVVGVGIFIAMGWIGVISAIMLFRDFGWTVVGPLFLGGALYTVGAIANVMQFSIVPRVWGAHETFHVLVLAGLGAHWSLIARIADGSIRARSAGE